MYRRFAIYHAPRTGSALARKGAVWLGRDAETGALLDQPPLAGFDLAALTAEARRYGLHGTLKPPMRLAPGLGLPDLRAGLADLASGLAPVDLGVLRLRRLGGFLALVPDPQPAALSRLAAQVVAGADRFRAAPDQDELTRRRAPGLSPAQEALLQRWGYPYVMEEFRFHLTLTGRLPDAVAAAVMAAARAHLDDALSERQWLSDLALFGEDAHGVFHLLERVPLTG